MWYLDTRPARDIYINKSLLFWICFYSPSWQRWVGTNDSSSRSGDWEARWCWWRRSSRTWRGPRTLWTPWSPPAQSCPGLSDQMTPRTESVSSPTSYTQTRKVRIGLTIIFLLGKFPKGQAVIDLDDDFVIFFISHLQKFYQYYWGVLGLIWLKMVSDVVCNSNRFNMFWCEQILFCFNVQIRFSFDQFVMELFIFSELYRIQICRIWTLLCWYKRTKIVQTICF